MDQRPTRSFTLEPLHEYRFELDPTELISIKVTKGTAEISGFELTIGQVYHFGDEVRTAIFSWHGADLEVTGRATTEYVAEESSYPTYFALHLALEKSRLSSVPPKHFHPTVEPPMRLKPSFSSTSNNGNINNNEESSSNQDPLEEKPGPRVMVIGSVASGKSTLIKTLANWAVRSGRAKLEGPGLLLVNLNPNDGGYTIPGTFSIAPLNVSIPTTTSVLPLGSTPTTGPPVLMNPPPPPPQSETTSTSNTTNNNGLLSSSSQQELQPTPNPALFAPPLNSLTFYYGHTQFNRNLDLARCLISRMGTSLENRIEKSLESSLWRGGILIDTPAEFSDKSNSNLVKETVRAFGVNVIVVLGNEKMYLEISKLMMTNKTVQVIRVPKNGGASDLDLNYRKRLESSQIRSYFYGGPFLSQGQLSPFTIVVKFDDLSIFRIGGDEAQVPSSALPLGATRSLKPTSLIKVDLSEDLMTSPSGSSNNNKTICNNLLNLILSIPQAEWDGNDIDSDLANQACSGPSLGFVHLSAIDLKNRKFTILSPLPGRLPRKVAIGGSLEWIDG